MLTVIITVTVFMQNFAAMQSAHLNQQVKSRQAEGKRIRYESKIKK